MPGGDRTGPGSMGPRTGRAAGYCSGFSEPGFMNPSPRFGRGMRRGFGRGLGFGWRRQAFAPAAQVAPVYQEPSKEQELQMLENEAKALAEEQKLIKEDMEAIKKRVAELRKSK